MLKLVDKFLNKITMYRLVFYYVLSLWVIAVVLSLFGLLPFGPIDLLISLIFIEAVCFVVNAIFARIFDALSNIESVYTTGLILALIISPANPLNHLMLLGLAALIAMASKYILAINKKHIFNPAAFAAALVAIILGQSANWWVGNLYIFPFVLIGGVLMVRKLRRWDLVSSFLLVALVTTLVGFFFRQSNLLAILKETILYSPLLFFACVMLTEPMTTPPTKNLRIVYGGLIGFLFSPLIHVGSIYFTPELALLSGNIFSYIVSPKDKLVLILKEKKQAAKDVYDFLFKPEKKLKFKPGQYMEWTLGHDKQDARGMRRYFTIASSPTEDTMRMGVKFYPNPSSFKKNILSLKPGDKIVASQLAGDFVLPKDKNKKLAFIAGGIGITPFRSMIKYLLDMDEKRNVVLLYSNYTPDDIAYRDVFDASEKRLGIKAIYTITGKPYPDDWRGECGMVDEPMILRLIPDYKERTFYLSGSNSMVVAFETILLKIGVPKHQIKKDFFPGFA